MARSVPVVSSKATTTNPKDLLGLKKVPLRLIMSPALLWLARVMGGGAVKYGPWNWRAKHVRHMVYLEAIMRHTLLAADGEEVDEESGYPHEAHIMACAFIILDAKAVGALIDDRAKSPDHAMQKLMNELIESGESAILGSVFKKKPRGLSDVDVTHPNRK